MTGRIHYTPEAERQLDDLDEWITKKASADTARRVIKAVMDQVDGILAFPFAGRGRDDVRPGMRNNHLQEAHPDRLRGGRVVRQGRGQCPWRLPRRPRLGSCAAGRPGRTERELIACSAWHMRSRTTICDRPLPTPANEAAERAGLPLLLLLSQPSSPRIRSASRGRSLASASHNSP